MDQSDIDCDYYETKGDGCRYYYGSRPFDDSCFKKCRLKDDKGQMTEGIHTYRTFERGRIRQMR